jgi:probable phosphoglycerate mutase
MAAGSVDNPGMTELILIRHGETDWNRELRFQGQVDVPLNAVGHEQARRVGLQLAGESVQQLVCSDLLRTRQTAMPPAQQLAMQPVNDSALREQNFGVVDGMRVEDIQTQFPQAWSRWTEFDADFAFDAGESTRAFHARVMGALAALTEGRAGQRLLVVTHGGVLDMVYRSALGLSLSGPRQSVIPNGAINRVRMQGYRVEIVSWAETAHLQGMPAQPVYDQSKTAQRAAQAAVSIPNTE